MSSKRKVLLFWVKIIISLFSLWSCLSFISASLQGCSGQETFTKVGSNPQYALQILRHSQNQILLTRLLNGHRKTLNRPFLLPAKRQHRILPSTSKPAIPLGTFRSVANRKPSKSFAYSLRFAASLKGRLTSFYTKTFFSRKDERWSKARISNSFCDQSITQVTVFVFVSISNKSLWFQNIRKNVTQKYFSLQPTKLELFWTRLVEKIWNKKKSIWVYAEALIWLRTSGHG